MQAPQYGAEVPGEEQQGNGPERDEEGADLVLGLAVVGVPDLGSLCMVARRIAGDEVPRRLPARRKALQGVART